MAGEAKRAGSGGGGGGSEFDLERVAVAMEAALTIPGRVLLAHYLEAYRQLNRLFPSLGFLWGFIHSDIAAKVDRLTTALAADTRLDVATAFLNGVTEPPLNNSHTTAFIRLHRALEFIARVVGDCYGAGDEEALTPVVRMAYDETLGRYHGALIRGACHMAFKTLGRRREFAPLLLSGRSREQAGPIVARVVTGAKEIHARLQPTIATNPLLRNVSQS